jgi:hypothetical protein
MKSIFLFICGITLVFTSGCLVSDGRGRGPYGHARYERHADVIVGPPVIEVRAPEVIVR